MKIVHRFHLILIALHSSTAPLLAQGYLVPNGVTYGGYIPSIGSAIHVLQNPTNGNYTGFNMPPLGDELFGFLPFADEGVRVFLVPINTPFTSQTIMTAGYVELGYPPTGYVFNEGVPFYTGLYTSDQFPQNGVYANPMFGWAQLVNNGGVIELLDSALAYNAAGIYAGTLNMIQVPEPSVLSLIGLTTALSVWLRRATFRGPKPAGYSDP